MFGVFKIRPFKDLYSKKIMKEWKLSETVHAIHKELYNPLDPDDPVSDIYLSFIIQSVFTQKKKQKKMTSECSQFWKQYLMRIILIVKLMWRLLINEIKAW